MSSGLHIYFIRHGETEWSRSGQHTGLTDLPLTPRGDLMARQLAPVLSRVVFSLVLTSPRLRARHTCELAGFTAPGIAQVDANLAEWNYGKYEGLRTSDIRKLQPNWDIWEQGCPEGEHPADVSQRANQLIDRLLGMSGNVALFSHGQFGRALVARWIGLAAREGQHFAIDPASVGILGFDPDYPSRRIISLWNFTPALAAESS